MRVMVDSIYSGQTLSVQARKRKHDEVMLESDVKHPTQAVQQWSDSAPTSFAPLEPHLKRQRLPFVEPHDTPLQSSTNLQDRQSFSGSGHTVQPSAQHELQWTASDGHSTCNSVGKPSIMMEEDQQSVTPTHQVHQQLPPRNNGMSHSSSAPDLRLLLTTELPDTKQTFLPVAGSYAGVMVPYKGPERVIAEAHQHVTSELVIRLIDDFHATLSQSDFADTSNQGSTLPDAMEVTTDPSTETMSSQQLAHQPQNNAAERLGKRRLSSEQVSASSRKRGRCSASAASEHEPAPDVASEMDNASSAADYEMLDA